MKQSKLHKNWNENLWQKCPICDEQKLDVLLQINFNIHEGKRQDSHQQATAICKTWFGSIFQSGAGAHDKTSVIINAEEIHQIPSNSI